MYIKFHSDRILVHELYYGQEVLVLTHNIH